MPKEIMSTPVEIGCDGSADLIADLLEFLLIPMMMRRLHLKGASHMRRAEVIK